MRSCLATTAVLLTAASLAACSDEGDSSPSPSSTSAPSSTYSYAPKYTNIPTESEDIAASSENYAELMSLMFMTPCEFTEARVTPIWNETHQVQKDMFLSSYGTLDGALAAAKKSCELQGDGGTSDQNAGTPQATPEYTPQQPAPFDAAAEAPAPPADVTLGAGKRWNLMGPFASLNTCDQNASLQPIQTSQCFTLSDGNAYFWNVVQG